MIEKPIFFIRIFQYELIIALLLMLLIIPAYAQEAVEGLNDSFGGINGGLRGILDGISGIETFFGNLGCYIQGTFLGWENVDCIIK